MRRICALSVDVDPIACYTRIHGLGEPAEELREIIERRALPRLVEIFERHGVPATFFLVGESVRSAAGRAAARELAGKGFELGNHSDTHPYDLAKRGRAEIIAEIRAAHDRIAEACGREHAPVGFRSPGYDLSVEMLGALAELGYRYDSSIFPSPPYYLAKAAIMTVMRLLGRRSESVLGDPRTQLAPTDPYRPDVNAPWRRGQSSLVELPVAVVPWSRMPAIGTSVVLLPGFLRARMLEGMRNRPFFNLELHAIDLASAAEDGISPAIVKRQPDLRRPLADKRRALEATIDRLKSEYEFLTLRAVAAEVQREGRV